MLKSLLACAALAAMSATASAGVVSFGSLSLTANDPTFLSSFSTSSSGNTYTMNFDQFSQSNFATPSPGELDFSITGSSTAADIIGATVTFFGTFVDGGEVDISQTIGAFVQSGGFSLSPIVMSQTFGVPVNSVDFSGSMQLNDNGGSAQISKVTIEVLQRTVQPVPEPSTFALAGLALFGLASLQRRRT